jgi:hypothetical protein
VSINSRTGKPFINPRFADLLSEPELFGLGRKASPEADSQRPSYAGTPVKTEAELAEYQAQKMAYEDDVVFPRGGGWYFWDEDYLNCIGPFATKAEAVSAVLDYAEGLE